MTMLSNATIQKAMVIRHLKCENESFESLVNYTHCKRADENHTIYNNLNCTKPKEIIKTLEDNFSHIKQKNNGRKMRHELVSIKLVEGIPHEKQKEKLRAITYNHIANRAPNNIVIGSLHDDHENQIHYHLSISSNELGESKRHRLNKHQYEYIKLKSKKWALENFPELFQKFLQGMTHEEETHTQATQIKEILETIIHTSNDKQKFLNSLEAENLEMYYRGKTIGVTDKTSDENHRLKKFGLLDDYEAMKQRFEEQETTTEKQTSNENNQQQHEKKAENTPKIEPLKPNEITDDKPLLKKFMSRLNGLSKIQATDKIKKHTVLFLGKVKRDVKIKTEMILRFAQQKTHTNTYQKKQGNEHENISNFKQNIEL